MLGGLRIWQQKNRQVANQPSHQVHRQALLGEVAYGD